MTFSRRTTKFLKGLWPLVFIVFLRFETFAQKTCVLSGLPISAEKFYIPDSILPVDSENPKIYLLGEAHGVAGNPIIQFAALKFFYETHQVRTLAIEFGSSEAWIYQRFLATGDTSLLRKTTYGRFSEYRTMWKHIYDWNRDLPVDERLKVVGLDFERPHLLAGMLQELFKIHGPSTDRFIKEFADSVNAIKDMAAIKDLPMEPVLEKFRDSLEAYYAEWNEYLGDDFPILELIAGNQALYDRFLLRDPEMYNNLVRYYENNEVRGNVLCLIGFFHSDLSRKKSFISYLNDSDGSPWFENAVSIKTVYHNCRYFDPYASESEWNKANGKYDYAPVMKLTDCIIPQLEDDFYLLYSNSQKEKILPTGFHYFLFMQNQEACTE